jgi:hypothetical protein
MPSFTSHWLFAGPTVQFSQTICRSLTSATCRFPWLSAGPPGYRDPTSWPQKLKTCTGALIQVCSSVLGSRQSTSRAQRTGSWRSGIPGYLMKVIHGFQDILLRLSTDTRILYIMVINRYNDTYEYMMKAMHGWKIYDYDIPQKRNICWRYVAQIPGYRMTICNLQIYQVIW